MTDLIDRLRAAGEWTDPEQLAHLLLDAEAEIELLRAERALIVARAENAEAALEQAEAENAALKSHLAYAASTGDECAVEVEALRTRAENAERALEQCEARLAELERNEGTLLGMIRHQQDVLRECLPYINESMAGRRPGRCADDIRAAVKALTADSAPALQPCGHPWKAQHDSKCILCSSPGVTP